MSKPTGKLLFAYQTIANMERIIEEQKARIAVLERVVEPVAAPAGYFCEPYPDKPGVFEQVFDGFDDPDVLPLYRDPGGRIAALEREVEALRKDAERLNHIERNWFYREFDELTFRFNETWSAGKHETLRDAIDAEINKALAAVEAG